MRSNVRTIRLLLYIATGKSVIVYFPSVKMYNSKLCREKGDFCFYSFG